MEINTYEKIPHQVDIYYNIYLDAEKSHYSDFQQFENQNNKVIVYQPSPLKPELLEQIRHNYPNWLEENKAIRITFESKGELIKLTNRNELLEQHTLETPIKAAILHHSTRKKVNVKKSLGNAAIVPVAIIALPLLTLTCFGKQPKSFASSFVNLCPFR
ncbi:MAG: hypothetical protein Q4D78_03185 [Neisseria zoodegmatis]|uniref:hypothetical protein n=1 Tax=Neisseria zoodegmatis TaxID=326523 RepID=UPI0026E95DD7|nr:hypothetical protein [Neisseria zoodegmatis]MDO5069190.1 hypothetical protein [Neisseria zoodegmatis]